MVNLTPVGNLADELEILQLSKWAVEDQFKASKTLPIHFNWTHPSDHLWNVGANDGENGDMEVVNSRWVMWYLLDDGL
ncbi:unnamed protein product [Ilex paraguariensis]|uniref:Uncharacterized protein n=1 Tax=Ilex paraguariensis TaxID=185542 RepID=A0ABC8SIP5_9AQUA